MMVVNVFGFNRVSQGRDNEWHLGLPAFPPHGWIHHAGVVPEDRFLGEAKFEAAQ